MNAPNEKDGVWFVYDGECPICNHAAEALRIKEDYGTLHTINARDVNADPLMDEINRRGLDLDEGMVIYTNGQFFHGKDALKFMAQYGEHKNIFMAVFKGLFWSDLLSRLMYPWLRGARNWLLRRKNIHRIDNLGLKNEPIFKSIFGDQWDDLPPVMKKHYTNRPYTQDTTTVRGVLDVMCKPPLLYLSPLMKLLGQIPIRNEANVPVTVHFQSDVNSRSFYFNRIFNFANSKPYPFQSRMLQIHGDEVIEIMRFGLGWKLQYAWDGEKVILSHKGYALQLFGHLIPLPLTMLMGAGYAEEHPVDDNTFDMQTHITHPWWGKIYEYKGRFEVSE
jgi:predicted DCC family thiol-disulfide oxidoreductase YuxK